MKKILLVLISVLLLTSCSNDTKKEWKMTDLIEYSKGEIVYSNEKETKINNTTHEELNDYLKALQTVTYNYIEDYSNNNPYYMTNNSNYIKIEYVDTYSDQYTDYNIIINIYKSKEDLK